MVFESCFLDRAFPAVLFESCLFNRKIAYERLFSLEKGDERDRN